MFNIGPEKLLLLLAIALLVLGPSRLPQAARTLAKVLAELRKVTASVQNEVGDVLKEPRQIIADALREPQQALQEHRDAIAGIVGDFRLDGASTASSARDEPQRPAGLTGPSAGSVNGEGEPATTAASNGALLPLPPDDPTLN